MLLKNIRARDARDVTCLYIDDLGEDLEAGVGIRRYGALFVIRAGARGEALWPVQFLGIPEDTPEGMVLTILGGLRIP